MRRATILGLALAMTACTGGGEAEAPPERYAIAYSVLHDEQADDYEVFLMELDGSGKRNLTEHPAVDWVYRAHGSRLYIVSDRESDERKYLLYELETRDGSLRQITDFHVRDSWIGIRGDGEELVVASSKDGGAELYLINREGEELRRLTEDDVYDNDPVVSPDGRSVVWRSKRDAAVAELWAMELETGAMRRLTFFPEDDPAIEEHTYHAGPPAWHPTNGLISFCSKRDGYKRIYTIRPDGSDLTEVTPEGMNGCWHDWSPDGRYLAFGGTDETGNYDIYLHDTVEGGTSRLTHGPEADHAPVFVTR